MEIRSLWKELVLPRGEKDHLWELFHENSKLSPYEPSLPHEKVLEEVEKMHESLTYRGLPTVDLPDSFVPFKIGLRDAIESRRSNRTFTHCPVSLELVGTLLHFGYGRVRSRGEIASSARPSRAVPSAGALYPLEIFFYSQCLQGQRAGFYHYNPCDHRLWLVKPESNNRVLENAVVDHDCVENCSIVVFITARFHRSIFKYGDRGYRFILIEAGHVAQNLQLVAEGLGLSTICIGGFFDRRIDELLRLDGLTESTIYLLGVGGKSEGSSGTSTNAKPK